VDRHETAPTRTSARPGPRHNLNHFGSSREFGPQVGGRGRPSLTGINPTGPHRECSSPTSARKSAPRMINRLLCQRNKWADIPIPWKVGERWQMASTQNFKVVTHEGKIVVTPLNRAPLRIFCQRQRSHAHSRHPQSRCLRKRDDIRRGSAQACARAPSTEKMRTEPPSESQPDCHKSFIRKGQPRLGERGTEEDAA
jgi:hypothetical protein